MSADFDYRNNEWEIDGALVSTDVQIVLTVETVDGFGVRHEPVFTLADAYQWHAPVVRPAWLAPLMTAWIAANQTTLTQSYYDARSYLDAAQ